MRTDPVLTAAMAVVMASWAAFCLAFVLRKRPPRAAVAKRDSASRWGIAMQGVAYAIMWGLQRALLPRFLPLPRALEMALAILAVPMAMASAWLTIAAVRTLGKQWSIEARLAEGHRLIVGGPYSYLRHPIYTAMLGLLVATGLVISHWLALVAAIVLFSIGNAIRVRAEDKLLLEAFGEDFEAYRRYVPAILPRLHAGKDS